MLRYRIDYSCHARRALRATIVRDERSESCLSATLLWMTVRYAAASSAVLRDDARRCGALAMRAWYMLRAEVRVLWR